MEDFLWLHRKHCADVIDEDLGKIDHFIIFIIKTHVDKLITMRKF